MASFEDYKCILCYNIPSSKNDMNFLDGKESIRSELDDLPFVVVSSAKCISKRCLSLVNKRKTLEERIADINNNIITCCRTASISATGIPLRMKVNAAKKLTYVSTDPCSSSASTGSRFGCPDELHSSDRLV